ncbi:MULTISPECIES: DUF4365 domain-containing protein [Sphingobacterium]|uniref:DUF4365 domain-containing protein n=1 Tax=Sphingobacterium populi TaxID=1812824 RepID=A0ABW5UAP1_9SPHI|nr:DUF4365 domain-containing protein [Sphingobacterium sp. CFCC 11742]
MVYNVEERIGIYSVAKIFSEKLQWIFREQPINDFGIDGFIELTKYDVTLKIYVPTGKLFGIQVKSGKSYFKEKSNNSLTYRGSKKHVDYWKNYSIPVFVIIYDKELNRAYWQNVNSSTIILTSKSFKLKIPLQNIVDKKSSERLAGLTFYKNTYEYKLWQLRNSIKEVKALVKKDQYLYVEIESSHFFQSYSVTLIISDENCNNPAEVVHRLYEYNSYRFEYRFLISKDNSLKEAINDTLPWADLFLADEEFSDKLLIQAIFKEILNFHVGEFNTDIIKLKDSDDLFKLATYLADSYAFQIKLKPNQLGYAFLELENFLNKDPIVKQRVFI